MVLENTSHYNTSAKTDIATKSPVPYETLFLPTAIEAFELGAAVAEPLPVAVAPVIFALDPEVASLVVFPASAVFVTVVSKFPQ
jgi:hypothetical protein